MKNASLISIEEKNLAKRKIKIQKMEFNLAKKIEKNKQHSEICNRILLQILEIADVLDLNMTHDHNIYTIDVPNSTKRN